MDSKDTGTDAEAGTGPWAVPGYTHEHELGSGASGQVVLARHDITGTPVAIKYLTRLVGADRDFRAEFRDEAQLLGDLDSPHVARLYEYVESESGAAIVMELVDGVALRVLLRQEGATGPEAALTVLKGSLLGLAAAHAAGVVHRDYKPENVLVALDGSSKLVDFGIAVRNGETRDVAGTPSYMAPEQWAGKPATPASDVYAATATFFECLSGAKPYAGSTLMELAVQHTEAPIPDEQVPEPVRPLIRRGLAKTPQARPGSAAAFVDELEAVASAAYGEDWEERGQRKLAALTALLPLLLFPSAGGQSTGTTTLAETHLKSPAARRPPHSTARRRPLTRRGKLAAGAAAAVVLSGGLAVSAVATNGALTDASGPTAKSLTTTSLVGGPSATASATTAGPSTSGSPSLSASASATPSVSVTGTPTTAPAPTTDSASPGTTAGPGTPTTPGGTVAPPSISPSPPKPLHVISVNIERFSCYGNYGAQGFVTVQTDGAADGTLTLNWFHSSTEGSRGSSVVATETVTLPKGKQTVSGTYSHVFSDTYPYWGLTVSTTPAADSGNNSSKVLWAPNCNPPR